MLCLDAIKLSLSSLGRRALLVQLLLVGGCQALSLLGDPANVGLQRPNLVVKLHSMLWAVFELCPGSLCWHNMLLCRQLTKVSTGALVDTCARGKDPVAGYTQAYLYLAKNVHRKPCLVLPSAARCSSKGG